MNNTNTYLKISQKLQKLPFLMILIVILISLYGFLAIYSSSGGKYQPLVNKQVIIFITSLIFAIILSMINLRSIFRSSYIIYFLTFVMLVITELVGKKFLGAKRWISFYNIQIQPSELMKISLILALARYFNSKAEFELKPVHLFFPILLITAPVYFILKQPDLGTSLIIAMFSIIIFFAIGVKMKYFVYLLIFILVSLPFMWHSLYPHQKDRIVVFFQPHKDIFGKGYHIYQSKIAIGSGGLWGKGLMQGTQTQLKFLPENKTDFIFALIAEELGLIGVTILILLYIFLIWLMMSYINNICSVYGKIIIIGVSSMLFFHVVVNIGMNIGTFPITGIPLPFVSYGGTSIVSMMSGLGLVLNCKTNKNFLI